jgi:hypothetical protein
MQRRKQLEKLVSATNALRDAPGLPDTGPEDSHCFSTEQQHVNTAQEQTKFDPGFAGEIGSVYVPSMGKSWSKGKTPAAEDDLFSDVADDDGDTEDDDDEDEWNAEFARAEVEVEDAIRDGREWAVGHNHARLEGQECGDAKERSKEVVEGTEPVSAPVAAGDSAAAAAATAAYVKHTPMTATRDSAYPATSAPSPTESQLAALGFEFHRDLPEEKQISRFGDKAFRKALREVLPSLSRKQQWYAWRRVNEENYGESVNEKCGDVVGEEHKTSRDEANQESGDGERKCPGTTEGRTGEDRTCEGLVNGHRCGNCADYNEHHRPKGVGEEGREGLRDRQPGPTELDCIPCSKTFHFQSAENRKLSTWTSLCGCAGDESMCQCSLDRCPCRNRPKIQKPHHRPGLNAEVADRPSGWTGLFSHGRLVDGESASSIREGLDRAHDVPTPTTTRIPGLGMFEQLSNVQPTQGWIRCSVEPETPHRQLHRESTPAFEDRSPSPSPVSHKEDVEDVEMTDVPPNMTSKPQSLHLPLPQPTSSPDPRSSPMHAVTAPQTSDRPHSRSRSRSRSPAKAPVAAPDSSTPKSTKRGGRRKSAVQGSKVEKKSSSNSRAVSRKVTTAVKNAAGNATGQVKEAVARIEARVQGEQELTSRRSARIKTRLEREGTPQM